MNTEINTDFALSSDVIVIVGSTNPVKAKAAETAFKKQFSGRNVTILTFAADPGITNWRSKNAEGQPFGATQTAFGAIHRTIDCWNNQQKVITTPSEKTKVYAVSFENGLVAPSEANETGENWLDICFTAIFDGKHFVISRSDYVETNFAPPEETPGEPFDQAVVKYEKFIWPLMEQKIDLYSQWKHRSGKLGTRDDYQVESALQSLLALSHLEKADALVNKCVELGFPASVGNRYNTTIWMRDFAYMAPVYLSKDSDKYLTALKDIRNQQITNHTFINDEYQTNNCFGSIPIVYIPKANERTFLLQRIQGSHDDPAWQMQLWDFCEKQCPDFLDQFPRPTKEGIGRPLLDNCSTEELRQYYEELLQFTKEVQSKYSEAPGASFTLRAFINGNLRALTAGTRDSEIHYLRAICSLIKKKPEQKLAIMQEFGESMAKAIFYLYTNVVDAKDSLPTGIDSRDIFSDILYDAKVLSNAVFLYEALQSLVEYADSLKETSFSATVLQALQEQTKEDRLCPEFIEQLATEDLSVVFTNELQRLKSSIQNQLLFNKGNFEPRDFVPGARASIALEKPKVPTPVAGIIKADNPRFVDGTTVDPQSLAYAVLADLVPREHYAKVINHFKEVDSKIGIQVFVPISGKTREEDEWLRKVKGMVVWPHVTWTAVKALIKMGAIHMAEEQIKKLMAHGECREWVAVDPETQEVFKGGDPEQGWSATSMLTGMVALKEYYATQK